MAHIEQSLFGKVALVTGSTRGIGRASAQALARRGASVVINFPTAAEQAEAEQVAKSIAAEGGAVVAIEADVTRVASIETLFARAISHFGGLDFVVSNVGGTLRPTPIADYDEALFDQVTNLNAKSTFFTLRAAARYMRDGGRIVAISSSTTRSPYAGIAGYAGAKAAIELYCKVLAHELGGRRITVNSISPGLTDTEGMRAAGIADDRLREVVARTPLGRLGVAMDIAESIVMLISDEAHWITGQHLNAGGGAF